jgi:type II secretory pathway pseudopilin PulG
MRRDKGKESGYALLLVFLMAAMIAISLYAELPRVAFQSQRHKEQLLMQRGQQYMRAIQVYWQVNHTYPPNLDAIKTPSRPSRIAGTSCATSTSIR